MLNVLIFSADTLAAFDGTCVAGPSVNRLLADDPRSALRQARQHQPRLTVVDAAVAGAAQLIRRLRLDPKARDTGIVALSATSDLSDEDELRQAGANLVLARPINAVDWDGPLRRLLEVPRRRTARLPATFEIWDGPATAGPLKGRALNISVHGVLLECRPALPVGTKVDITLTLPTGEVRALGEIVREAVGAAGRQRRGVQFLVLRGASAERITRFVAGTRESAPPRAPIAAPEAHQWEAELRASEARVRSLLESAPDAVVLLDHQGRAREMNAAAQAMFETTRDAVLGQTADRLLPEPLRQMFRCALAHQVVAVEHLLGGPHEVTTTRADGGTLVAELTFRRFTSKGCDFWALFARDVTRRRSLAHELHASQRRFQTLVEYSADGIALVERDGRFRYLTASAAGMFGYQSSELIGHTFDEMVDGEDVAEARLIRRRALDQPGTPVRGEVKCRHRDGSRRVIEGVVVNHLDTPEVGALVVNYRDATHRHRTRQLEEELRQAQKIEALGRLAGGVAHDFNNLIGVIMGASRLAANRATDPETQRRLDQVQRASEKAAALTHQLLAFSRKQVLMPEVVDAGLAVNELAGMLDRLVGEDIAIATLVPERSGRVRVDRNQLEQALTNLVVNARDAMPKGGRLTLEVADVAIDGQLVNCPISAKPGDYVRISVSDTGQGMDDDTQGRVFEPFFTTKERGKGTGLGLATTYGIVKQSGGYITVQSTVGAGSRFDIFLPRVDAEPSRIESVRAPRRTGGGETVLLVEDDPMLRRIAADMLQAAGYPVLEAGNGDEALALSRRHPHPLPLLVTDIVMPGMSGRQLAEQLLRERAEMRVLYMSGYTDDEILRHGIVEGTVELLSKPFAPDALSAAVRRVLDKSERRMRAG